MKLRLRPDWMEQAACRSMSTRIFHPGKNDHPFYVAAITEAAKEVCARCPVMDTCLAFALHHHEFGIWGGTTTEERKVLMGLARSHHARAV